MVLVQGIPRLTGLLPKQTLVDAAKRVGQLGYCHKSKDVRENNWFCEHFIDRQGKPFCSYFLGGNGHICS